MAKNTEHAINGAGVVGNGVQMEKNAMLPII